VLFSPPAGPDAARNIAIFRYHRIAAALRSRSATAAACHSAACCSRRSTCVTMVLTIAKHLFGRQQLGDVYGGIA